MEEGGMKGGGEEGGMKKTILQIFAFKAINIVFIFFNLMAIK